MRFPEAGPPPPGPGLRSPTTRLKGVRAAASPSSHATAVPTLSPSSTVRSPPEDGNAIEVRPPPLLSWHHPTLSRFLSTFFPLSENYLPQIFASVGRLTENAEKPIRVVGAGWVGGGWYFPSSPPQSLPVPVKLSFQSSWPICRRFRGGICWKLVGSWKPVVGTTAPFHFYLARWGGFAPPPAFRRPSCAVPGAGHQRSR